MLLAAPRFRDGPCERIGSMLAAIGHNTPRGGMTADRIEAGALRSVSILVVSQVAVLGLWFSAAAVLPALAAARGVPVEALAGLAAATQIGFVVGALTFAATGLPDRVDPRRVFALCGGLAALANLALLVLPADDLGAVLSRAAVGFALAGVYPVGLKIAVGWSVTRRGLITSLLVGALTLGSASPHLVSLVGGADWQATLLITSGFAVLGAAAILAIDLGPYHQRSTRFDPGAIMLAWRDPAIRRAYGGYFGHMWELYAFWAWVGVAAAQAALLANHAAPDRFGALIAFLAIGLGGVACVPAGWLADRVGKATVARGAMIGSAILGVLAAVSFGGPLILVAILLVLWGLLIIPDSAQFSALVADHAPPEQAGSLMTLQTALGFALTAVTVHATPWVVAQIGWSGAFLVLALGPTAGAIILRRA